MSRTASLLVALLLGLTTVAGCLGGSDDAGDDEPSVPAPRLYAPVCGLWDWPEPCLAFASPNESPGKSEIDLVANPTDPLNVVAASKDLDRQASDCVWSVAQASHDGGRTWKTSYVGGDRSRGPGDPLYGWGCVTDPIMAYDADGVLYYALQAYNYEGQGSGSALPVDPLGLFTSGSAFFLARSDDGGDTWGDIIPLHVGDGTAVFHDYVRMTANPATKSVYAVWNQISLAVGVPVVAGSRDGGRTPFPPVYVPVDEQPGGVGQSGIVAAKDGTVYLMLGGFFNGGPVWFTRSTDDARSFETPWKVFDVRPMPGQLPHSQFRTGTAVELAIDNSGGPHDGRLYAAWAEREGRETNISLRHSDDGGATWSDPVHVHPGTLAGWQFFPRPVVDDHGVVHVVYYTTGYDAENTLLDAEIAWSADGGASWTTQRLTRTSFDGDLGLHQDGFPFIGDYIGIGASGNRVWAGFSTTLTGRAEIAVAVLERNEAAAGAA